MSFCPHCGSQHTGGNFCSSCGAATATAGPAAPPVRRSGDVIRDLLACAALITALFLPWQEGQRTPVWSAYDDPYSYAYQSYGTVAGGEIAYVLLTVICALMSVALSRAPIAAGQGTGRQAIRVALVLPLLVVAVVAVGHGIADRDGLGVAVHLALFGAVMAAVPRRGELGPDQGAEPVLLNRWRVTGAFLGVLGGLSVLISTLDAVTGVTWSAISGAWAILVPLFGSVAFLIVLFVVPLVRAAQGRHSWQPLALAIMCGFLAAAAVAAGGVASLDQWGGSAYGIWLLAAAAGTAAVPTGSPSVPGSDSPSFWRLVAAHGFDILCVAAVLVLVVLIPPASIFNGPLPGVYTWFLVSAAVTLFLSLVGSRVLRSSATNAKSTARALALLVIVARIVDVAVGDLGALNGAAIPVGGLLTFGVPVCILIALSVPASRESGAAPIPASHRYTAPPEEATVAVPARVATPGDPVQVEVVVESAPAAEATVSIDPVASWSAPAEEHTRLRAPVVTELDPEGRAAADPATELTTLMDIAGRRRDLHATIAANPSAYPGLLDWLVTQGNPEVAEIVRRRRIGDN